MDQQFYGYGYNPYQPQQPYNDAKGYCQTLTVEEANSLRKQIEEFSLNLSSRDQLSAICMHRDPATGKSTLIPNMADDTVTCSICGKTFTIVDGLTEADVLDAVQRLIDVIQTTKTLYLDMPTDAARHFYVVLALIEKIPGLYKIASDNFASHEAAINQGYDQNNLGIMGIYNMMNGWGGFVNPMMGQPMMNPAMAGQPMGAPMMGQPYYGGGNPFYAQQPNQMAGVQMGAQPAPGYVPNMQGFSYSPNQMTQQATVATPQAPAAPANVPAAAPAQATTDGQNVQVTQQFTV